MPMYAEHARHSCISGASQDADMFILENGSGTYSYDNASLDPKPIGMKKFADPGVGILQTMGEACLRVRARGPEDKDGMMLGV